MIKIKKLLVLAFLGSFIIASCSKQDTNPSTSTTTASANCTCLVNGTKWAAVAHGTIMQGMMNVTGIQASDGQTITITMTGTSAGQYSLNGGLNAAAYKPDSGANTLGFTTGVNAQAVGTVNVTSIDTVKKTMTGTFSFVVERPTDNATKTITSGVFTNVPYSTTLPATSSSLSASVDGVSWVAQSVHLITAGSMVTVDATRNDGSTIGLYLPSNVTPGTYNFTPFGTYIGQYNKNSSTFYQAQSGSVTITTANSKTVAGTFSFMAANAANSSDMVNITNGTFSANY